MYGAKTWVLRKANELRLGVFERKILRRVNVTNCEGVTWRSRYNEELYRLYDNNNYYYLLQLGCYPLGVVILHVNKT